MASIGGFVAGTIATAGVTSSLSSATGITQGGTMTGQMVTGATKVVGPASKIKGTSMILSSIGKLKKKSKKIM